ncbi:hypothetical protein BJ878DRAFT_396388, partial [Calycina marina]
LFSKPTRWDERSRVVVSSPMLDIRSTDVNIPVRRFSGEKSNVVTFLPKQDIEKDSSSAYKAHCVSTTPTEVDVHAVALLVSGDDDDLVYEKHDKFWIMAAEDTSQYVRKVQVINLRTYV